MELDQSGDVDSAEGEGKSMKNCLTP